MPRQEPWTLSSSALHWKRESRAPVLALFSVKCSSFPEIPIPALTEMLRMLLSTGGKTPEEGGRWWKPQHRGPGEQVTFQSSYGTEDHVSWMYLTKVRYRRARQDMRFGSHSQETGHSRPKRRSFTGMSSPAPPAAPQFTLGDPECPRGVRATQSPSPRGQYSWQFFTFLFFFFVFLDLILF